MSRRHLFMLVALAAIWGSSFLFIVIALPDLIAWGQQYVDSGLAAIFNASAPLLTALFALPIDRTQRITGARLAGVVLAFGGVVLLVGPALVLAAVALGTGSMNEATVRR